MWIITTNSGLASPLDISKRVLTEEPKFIRKRKAKKEETVESTGIPGDVSTPENETD